MGTANKQSETAIAGETGARAQSIATFIQLIQTETTLLIVQAEDPPVEKANPIGTYCVPWQSHLRPPRGIVVKLITC